MGNLRVVNPTPIDFIYIRRALWHLREIADFLLGGEDRLFVFTRLWYSSRKAMKPMTRLS